MNSQRIGCLLLMLLSPAGLFAAAPPAKDWEPVGVAAVQAGASPYTFAWFVFSSSPVQVRACEATGDAHPVAFCERANLPAPPQDWKPVGVTAAPHGTTAWTHAWFSSSSTKQVIICSKQRGSGAPITCSPPAP